MSLVMVSPELFRSRPTRGRGGDSPSVGHFFGGRPVLARSVYVSRTSVIALAIGVATIAVAVGLREVETRGFQMIVSEMQIHFSAGSDAQSFGQVAFAALEIPRRVRHRPKIIVGDCNSSTATGAGCRARTDSIVIIEHTPDCPIEIIFVVNV
jgi:hypothetical protein